MKDVLEQPDELFGVLLRRLRERAGLTQQELAERAALTTHAVSALERGTRTRPYPHTVRVLADALGVSDAERATLIAAVPSRRPVELAPHHAHEVDVARDGSTTPGGVVAPPTRLYGRDRDIAAVAALVRSGQTRLLTLTGPGGVGKTRLLVAASEVLAADFPDGVVSVSLASLSDSSVVMSTIGRALALAGSDGHEAFDVVVSHLRPLRLLLVLDNFEQLLSAGPQVGQLSALAPKVTVLVSSRSPLRVRAEREYAVAPLDLPDRAATTLEQLRDGAAGALLWDRVLAVSGQDVMDSADVQTCVELCHRLAGLPLAIELASAHLRLLAPRMLLDRLDEVLASSGARDLPKRQRTMRATLDWSYGLLDPAQQRLFTILGAFRGGATIDALEAVAEECGGFGPGEVLALLRRLVEQSLVVVRAGPSGHRRFGLLEPVAQYARGLLVGDLAARAVRAHATYYLGLVSRAAAGYERADQVAWLATTEADEANILLAIERSLDSGDPATAGRITWFMWLYWWLRGQVSVGRRLAERCLLADLAPWELGRVRLAAATMAYAAGDYPACTQHWAEADRLGVALGDTELLCKARAGTGLAALATGDARAAEERFRDALDISRDAGEAGGGWLASLTRIWLGTVLLLQSQPGVAVTEIEHGLRTARARGDRLSTYVALYNLSQAAIALRDFALARRHLEEGIALSEQTRDLANLAYFLETLAVVESEDGRPARVATLLGAAAGLRDTVGAAVYAYYLPDETLRASAERAARAALGDSPYQDAAASGRALDLAGIVELTVDHN